MKNVIKPGPHLRHNKITITTKGGGYVVRYVCSVNIMKNDIITTQRLGHNEGRKKLILSLCRYVYVVLLLFWLCKVQTSVNNLRHTCSNKTKDQSERVKNYRT